MASHQFLAHARDRDPAWYRATEVIVTLAMVVSNVLSDALEDGAARVWRRLHH